MKINDVVKETGISKRTIHFYIEEHLIAPKVNEKNGYNIFSTYEVEKLRIIQKLRKADFSINDIRSIMQNPNTSHFYIQKQSEQLEKELDLLKQKVDCLSLLDSQLPINVSFDNLSEELKEIIFPDKDINTRKSSKVSDAKLISLYLWGVFLKDSHMTEYHKYLWDKVQKEMSKSNDTNILTLKKYLFSLSADSLNEAFALRDGHLQEIINLSSLDYQKYVNTMKTGLTNLLKDSNKQAQWRNKYFSNFLPLICLFDSSVNELIRELSPAFSVYCTNIHNCCDLLYQWLYSNEGDHIRIALSETFDGYLNIDENHHGELVALATIS